MPQAIRITDSPRRSPRLAKKRQPTRTSPRKHPITTITSFFAVDEARKQERDRQRRQKYRERRAAVTAEIAANASPPPPVVVTNRKPRTKAERAAARGRAPPNPRPSHKQKDPPPTSKATNASSNNRRDYKTADEAALRRAVEYWDTHKNEVGVTKSSVAARFGFRRQTFGNYVHDDVTKRKPIGSKPGRKSVVNAEDTEFIIQHTIRADRANDGLTCGQIIQNVQSLNQDLTFEQCKNWTYRTLRSKASGRIKPKLIKAQKTTSRRSQCSTAHQWRWDKNLRRAFDFLRQNNVGTCRKTGKTFGEIIDHFVIGLDEACFMADANGQLKIMGASGNKKHEKRVSDTRPSITAVRTGTSAGNNGPTGFLLKGKTKKSGFTDQWLEKEGCEPGSTIVMTENAFMTDEAWDEISKKIVKGYRSLPYIKYNPQWWVVELLDGFGSHLNVYHANKLRADNKILTLKEEAGTSHINQAYDRSTAKSDKHVHREALNWMLKDCRYNSGIIDQYKLMACVLAAVRHTKANPSIWSNSFIATNTCPSKMIPLADFCKKIAPHLHGSDSFDMKQLTEGVDKYSLLPQFWQAMEPSKKLTAVDIVNRYGGDAWGFECCRELSRALSVTIKELPSLQTCIFCAIEDPTHLVRGLEDDPPIASVPTEVQQLENERSDANDGLSMFQRCPDGLKGEELFDHSIGWMHRKYAKRPNEFKISSHLMVSPRNHHQRALLSLDYHQTVMGTLMDDVNEGVSKRAAAQCRLDNLGIQRGQSCFVNNPARLENQKFRLELFRSMGRSDEYAELEQAEKNKEQASKWEKLVPLGLELYTTKQTNVRKFTSDCIKALLLVVFGVSVKGGTRKATLLTMLDDEVSKFPHKIAEAIVKYPVDNDASAPVPPLPLAQMPEQQNTPPVLLESPNGESIASMTNAAFSPDSPLDYRKALFNDDDNSVQSSPAKLPSPSKQETNPTPSPVPVAVSQTRWLYNRSCEVAELDKDCLVSGLEVAKAIMEAIEVIRAQSMGEKNVRMQGGRICLLLRELTKSKHIGFPVSFFVEISKRIDDLVYDDVLNNSALEELSNE